MVHLLAFSLQDQVEKYGAYIGIAAFFGLAVLSILYFAQARELKRLRDWAGRAPERAQELEQRVVQQAEARRTVQAQPQTAAVAKQQPGVAAKPAATPAGKAAAVAAPATAAAAAAAAANAPATASVTPASEVKDAEETDDKTGVAAAGETTEDPSPTEHEIVASKGTGEADETETEDAVAEDTEDAAEEGEAVGVAAGATPATTASGATLTTPPAPPSPPATATPGNGAPPAGEIPTLPARATPTPPPRRSAPAPAPYRPDRPDTGATRRVPPPRRPLITEEPEPRKRNGIVVAGAAAGLILIVVAIVAILGGGGNDGGGQDTASTPTTQTQTAATTDDTTQEATGGGEEPDKPDGPTRAETTVRVFNGTVTSGLATGINDRVREAGYADGGIPENFTDQARSASVIFYSSSEFRSQAIALGKLLTVSDIRRTDATVAGLAPDADIVVVVGADQS